MKNIVIIGAGIVGLAIARELARKGHKRIEILEKEAEIASHQSSRNSGVMHAGLYYSPGSLKANLSRKGINLMKNYCNEHNILWNECGKIVVATKQKQLVELEKLFSRGEENNLIGLRRLDSKNIIKIEPHVEAISGLHVPEESIVNFKDVANSFLRELESFGIKVNYNSKLINYENRKNEIILENEKKVKADIIISASGLYSDNVSKILGLNIDNQKIVPFRGEYFNLKEEFKFLVKGLIYPVPDPSLPFLGVHFTRMINNNVEAGPNAVLAMAREGYGWTKINLEEFTESLFYPGLINFVKKYPLVSFGEIGRSLSKALFVKSLRNLIPEIHERMLIRGDAGVRAQLMNLKGDLIQDFDIRVQKNIISILNAPSPAATSSIAIAKYVVNFLDLG